MTASAKTITAYLVVLIYFFKIKMKRILFTFFIVLQLLASTAIATQSADSSLQYDSFCYHDVSDAVDGNLEAESTRISTKHLAEHFNWLHTNGYNPISMDDLIAAKAGTKPLPKKAVLLTFDDGYASFYSHIYPLLKLYDYPAVFALVGKWLDQPKNTMVQYGDHTTPRESFLTLAQIKEMADSGLIEFASHTYDLHNGLLQNEKGSTAAAAVTHEYFRDKGRYENDVEYEKRIRDDLTKNQTYLKAITGKTPRILVWPYGKFNQTTVDIANEVGLTTTMTLDTDVEHVNNISDLSTIHRELIISNPNERMLVDFFYHKPKPINQRVMHVDLDYVYDDNEEQLLKNIDTLIARVYSLGPSTVYLQAFSDPDGDGVAEALYFPNRHLPTRSDLFSRVARQLTVRADVKVYAWMPVLAYKLPEDKSESLVYVKSGTPQAKGSYQRLSPFSKQSKLIVKEIYEDLGKYARFDGVLFHDDAVLSESEDDSDVARAVYSQEWQLPLSVEMINKEADTKQKWAALKTKWLIDFSLELADVLRGYQPNLKTARNLYASAMTNPESEAWLAHNYQTFLKHYDFTAVMAMPYMENIKNPNKWLKKLVNIAESTPNGLEKTVFEIQTIDWRNKKPIKTKLLAEQLEVLLDSNAKHVGYYPDDFIGNHPKKEGVRSVISVRDVPYLPK